MAVTQRKHHQLRFLGSWIPKQTECRTEERWSYGQFHSYPYGASGWYYLDPIPIKYQHCSCNKASLPLCSHDGFCLGGLQDRQANHQHARRNRMSSANSLFYLLLMDHYWFRWTPCKQSGQDSGADWFPYHSNQYSRNGLCCDILHSTFD